MTHELNQIYQSVLEGNMPSTIENVETALESGVDASKILKTALIPAMDEVGRLFEMGEYFVPEMLTAARAMKAGLKLLKPLLVDADIKPTGKVIIGTVQGDLHDIGKNLVIMMLEGAGFEINDLGTNVSPQKFATAIGDGHGTIVGLSALLTTTMPKIKATIDAISEAGKRDKVKVIIGGAPVTPEFAHEIGADGYAPDAGQAASLAKSLV